MIWPEFRRFRNCHGNDSIFWVRATTQDTIVTTKMILGLEISP